HHRGVRDLDDPVRGLDGVDTERRRAALLDRAPGAFDVELDLAAEEVLRVEPAEDDVRVRNSWLDAAAAVTDRAGIRTGALRADPQQATRVDPGDRTAAGPDLDEGDDRRAHRLAGEREAADARRRVAAHLVVLRHQRLAVLD